MLEKVVALDPQDWRSQYQLAVLLNEAGDVPRANEMLEKVTRLHPDFLPAQEELVMGLIRRGDLKQASAKVDGMIAEQPQAAEGHRLRALILWKQARPRGSAGGGRHGAGAGPGIRLPCWRLQAIALWDLERKKDALVALRQAAKIEPKVGTAEVFCRLLLCDARDIGAVSDFLRRTRYLLAPAPER